MAEVLTWDEIKRRYPDEFVILCDYTKDDNHEVATGAVFDHDRNRSELLGRQTTERMPNPFCFLFTGKPASRVDDGDVDTAG